MLVLPVKFKLNKNMTYNCDQCTGCFTLKRYLVLHKKYVHLKIRPYQCNVCEKSFPTMQKLSSHEISHNKTKSAIYTCDQCPGTFTLKESVGRHKKTVHQKILPHICNICDKFFANMLYEYGLDLFCDPSSRSLNNNIRHATFVMSTRYSF